MRYSYSSATALISRGVRSVFKTEFITGSIGDTITTGNLTINAGVRYDYQRGRNLPEHVLQPLLPGSAAAGRLPRRAELAVRLQNWQPRTSLAVQPRRQRRTRCCGRPTDASPTSSGSSAIRKRHADLERLLLLLDGRQPEPPSRPGRVRDHGSARPLLQRIRSGGPAQRPQRDPAGLQDAEHGSRFTVGADHQIFGDFAVSGTFTYRNTKNLQDTIPIGTDAVDLRAPGKRNRDFTLLSDGTTHSFSVPYYGLTLDEPPSGVLLYNRPGATQRYFGADVSVVKRLSHNWMLRASFGWNDFRQFVSPQSITDPNNVWGLGGQNDNDTLAVGYSSKAYLFINGRWQFNITGLYQFPLGINLGANFFGRQGIRSPIPYVRMRTRDVDGRSSAHPDRSRTTVSTTSTSSTCGSRRRSRSARSASLRRRRSST